MELVSGTDDDAQPCHVFLEEGCNDPHCDPPQSPELFSDTDNPIEKSATIPSGIASANNKDDNVLECDRSGSESTLFQTQDTCTPSRTKRVRHSTRLHSTSDDSSDYHPIPRKLTLKEIFQNHFGKKKRRSGKRSKYKRSKYVPCQKKPLKNRLAYRKRLWHRGIRFPFSFRKHLSFRENFAYEQFVVGGFLRHMENLKYEHSLHKSLKNMDAADDMENESLTMRKYKYLDDEGPLSPISEPDENVNCDQEEETENDAKIVENDCFILNCTVPNTKEWQKKKS
uniref:TATA box-binding protein-associated factor RNA polymerase I subunit D n=1 Tax=Leptobrachium leishanense TaxID=445787 RepID=A0A8C5LJ20_9ANUR